MQHLLGQHWHHLPSEDVADLLTTNPDAGLDLFEHEHRLKRFGPNQLSERKGVSPWLLLLLQFHQPLVYILLVATVVTALVKGIFDASVILGVVLVNAMIGFLQERKALRAITALAKSMTSESNVVRAGKRVRVPSTDIVPGDLVLLQSGDRVPADLRLTRVRDLQIDESTLTGESVPVEKQADRLPEETFLSDRTNMAFSSTLVTYGTGQGIVVGTGDQTEVGQISELISAAELPETPLTRKINRFSRVLLGLILALAGCTFIVGIVRGEAWADMFLPAVALAVGMIPEGLPAAVTITLAIGVTRMAQRRAIIRRLPAVETLGSTTVVCSDKTGTLTQNQMTVTHILAGGDLFRVEGSGYAPEGAVLAEGGAADLASHPVLAACLRIGLLCNDSAMRHTPEGWRVEGDPTEGALLVVARKAGLDESALAETLPRMDAIPFESQHQYMATLHRKREGGAIALVKGSLEALLQRCNEQLLTNGATWDQQRAEIEAAASRLAAQGLRVLAFAQKEFADAPEHLTHDRLAEGLVFAGVQAMIDPPRPEAIAAVRACRTAGISVKMITGDHPLTAAAIAAQLELADEPAPGEPLPVFTGAELAKLDDEALIEQAEKISVFARVSPEQKLRLVEALQVRGHVCAMTGDGVNDAPALRQADIGVAMGITGTEVAKEAGDIVLTDDNFASIEAAIEEGRGVFDNLTKFIVWTLPTNVGEGLVILAAVLVGAALPILPVQVLWINMTTAILLGLMLAFEPKEAGIMQRPPRPPRVPILTPPLFRRIGLVSLLLLAGSFGLFEWELIRGSDLDVARTVAVGVFVIGEAFYLLNCRSLQRSAFELGFFSNRWLLMGMTSMVLLQLAFTYFPVMNRLFNTAPLPGTAWLRIVGVGAVIYGLVGLEKWFIGRRLSSPVTPENSGDTNSGDTVRNS